MLADLDDIDTLLEILGNDTRRRILQLLAAEPRYFIQLSKDLGVSQQAVLKHLDVLERYGFITSYEGASEYAAPKRKYFQLNRSCMLAIGITKDAVQFVFHDIPQEEKDDDNKGELRALQRQVTDLEDEDDPQRILKHSDTLLKEINTRLADLVKAEVALLRLKQRITKRAHEIIRESFNDELHRQILYSTIGERIRPDVDELSTMLDIREKEIADAIKSLRLQLAGAVTF